MLNPIINAKYHSIIESFSRAFDITQEEVLNAVQRSYTFHNVANHTAVQRVLKKAQNGEDLTVVAIGGSITQGASAKTTRAGGNNARAFTEELGGERCWFDRTADWFRARFPETKINAINAGIGSTPSFLGTFRLEEMVLIHQPDLVVVEFSVNDPSTFPNLLETEIFEAYESVIRRCLKAGIAVIPIFMNDIDNNGLQHEHCKIAKYYQLPSISYHNAVSPDGKLICDWNRLSPDEIHPNNAGHAFLATCLCNYLDQLCDTQPEYNVPTIPEKWIHANTFENVWACYAHSLKDTAGENFEFRTQSGAFQCNLWNGVLVSHGVGTIQVTLPIGAKRVWIQYFHNPGSFETELNGLRTNCNTEAIGWPRPMWHRVYTGPAMENQTTLTIKTHAAGNAVIMGVLVVL